MRCNNCGWENADGVTHCIKCNTPLETSSIKQTPGSAPTLPSTAASAPASTPRKEDKFAGTITDSQLASMNADPGQMRQESYDIPSDSEVRQPRPGKEQAFEPIASINCPHPDCGYPYSPELSICPLCKRAATIAVTAGSGRSASAGTGSSETASGRTDSGRSALSETGSAEMALTTATPGASATSAGLTQRPDAGSASNLSQGPGSASGHAATVTPGATATPPAGDKASSSIYGKTIDPYRMPPTTIPEPTPPACYLIPIPKQGEPEGAAGPGLGFTYEQETIELNRENLEPGNNTITSKVQAELSFDNDTWSLKDRSDLQTTFLLVRDTTALKEGDVILVGDRKYIFTLSAPDDGHASPGASAAP